MRSILCFGDSNTHGYLASMQGERLGRWERWPGVVQRERGEDWYLIEEGLNGRTTMFDRPDNPLRNGLATLPIVLETHAPLDAVVVALGTSDVFVPGVSAARAAAGVETLTTAIRESSAGPGGGAPLVLAVVPPPFLPLGPEWEVLAPEAVAESLRFTAMFGAMAERISLPLLDLDGVAEPTPLDGVHFEADAHRAIGLAVAEALRALFPGG